MPPWKLPTSGDGEDQGAQFATVPNCGVGGCPSFEGVLCRMDCFDAFIRAGICCSVQKAFNKDTEAAKETQREICGFECPAGTPVGPDNCAGYLFADGLSDCKFSPDFESDPCKYFQNTPDSFWKLGDGTKYRGSSIYECLCPRKLSSTMCRAAPCVLWDYNFDPCQGINDGSIPLGPLNSPPGKGKPGDWEPDSNGGGKCKGGNKNGQGGGGGQAGGNIDFGKCCGNPDNGGVGTDTDPTTPRNDYQDGFCMSNGACGSFCQGDKVCMFMKDPWMAGVS